MTLFASKTRHKDHYRRNKFDDGKCKSCHRWNHSYTEGWNNFGNDIYLEKNEWFSIYNAEYTSTPPELSLKNECFTVSISGQTFHKLVMTILNDEATSVAIGVRYHHLLGLPYDDVYKTKKKIRENHQELMKQEREHKQRVRKYERQLKKEKENETICSNV